MSAHIYLRRWPMRPYTPATLSPAILTGLLRQRLGFDGLIFTDAMEMHSVSHNFTERYAAVAAVKAGADVILVTPDIEAGIDAVVQAVQRGDLPEARIDESVRRILQAKAKLGLYRQRTVAASDLPEKLGRSEAQKTAWLAAQKALTLLRNDGEVLPLSPAQRDSQVAVVMVSDRSFADIGAPLLLKLRRALPHLSVSRLSNESSDVALQDMAARVDDAALVIMPVFTFVQAYKGGIQLSENAVAAVRQVLQSGKPVVVISMGNPFILQQLPEAKVYLCAFGEKAQMQEAVAKALLGRAPIGGHIPVHLPGFFAKGDGIDITPAQAVADIPVPKPAPRLRQGFPEEAGFSTAGMARVDSMMQAAVQDSAFPGAVLLVARNAIIGHFKAYGNMGYGEYARPVPLNAIYDLASLTKVIATTTAAMLLVQEGKLDLDARVQDYLPEFTGAGKDSVSVRYLLVHASGLPPFKRYFLEELTPGEIVQRILQEPLEYSPGTETRYSDLGMILLGKIIEKLSGTTLDQFCRERVFAPLGMNETFFNPPETLYERIPPTEDDPWRQRMLHGVVHDENAFALGGVAGHAGLFSSAHDLAIFAQMLLNGGAYDHTRLLQPETIAQFTRRQNRVSGSDRALGWDTRSAEGSSSGHFMSMRAFGHTGFTGTSIWIDPENRLFVVLLTNRVHPTRANRKLYPFRPQLHDAIMQALQEK